jgi:uncharacterized protein YecE (DUF72 family)
MFPPGTRSTEFLDRYARVFNTVEGNTTFYALPPADTVARWRDQVPGDFEFCFKFPRSISHDKLLVDCGAELDELFETIQPLNLGSLMLQLPPRSMRRSSSGSSGFSMRCRASFTTRSSLVTRRSSTEAPPTRCCNRC